MKILIISNNPHNFIGGTEIYNYLLFTTFLEKKIECHEFSFYLNPENNGTEKSIPQVSQLNIKNKRTNKLTILSKLAQILRSMRNLKKIINKYDSVIISCSSIPWRKYIYRNKNVIYIQHFNPAFYDKKYLFKNKIISNIKFILKRLCGIKNPFHIFLNFVVFSKNDEVKLRYTEKQNFFIIPLARFSRKEIINFHNNIPSERNKCVYIGRIDDTDKNITKIKTIFNEQKLLIDFYGDGDKSLMTDDHYCSFKGKIKFSELKIILPNYRYCVNFSEMEGMPFALIESLSCCVPIISYNSSSCIEELIKGRGIFIRSQDDFNGLSKAINSIDEEEYNKMVLSCFNYALNNLCIEEFCNNWLNIVKPGM